MSTHTETRLLPLQAIARLVVLYRARHVPVYDWVTSEPSRHDLDHFVKAHHGRLSQTLAIGRDARAWMGVPVVPAASVAFLLLDDGNDTDEVIRFLAPERGMFPEPLRLLDARDPRVALRRVMVAHAANRAKHPEYEWIAYMLKAWNHYVMGDLVRAILWRVEDGLPRIASWPPDPRPGR
jgi:hypothetical protein